MGFFPIIRRSHPVIERNHALQAARAAEIRAANPATSDLTQPSDWLLQAMGANKSSSGAIVSTASASTVPVVFGCVSLLADMIGKLPLKLYRKTADGAEEATDHPAFKLVAISPGDMGTPFELRRDAQAGVGFGGNGYIRVWRDSYFNPGELQWIRPCDISPEIFKRSDGKKFARYHINGESQPLDRTDVIHVRALSTDGLCGLSPIRQLRESIGVSITQREQAGRIAANGARTPGILSAPPSLKKDQIDDARREWQLHQAGPENAGKTAILWGGWTYSAINGMTMADAEFIDSRKFERSEIATLYRIPEVLLGNSDKASSWGTGIETLTNGFLTLTLDPWLVNWEQSLNYTLLTLEEQLGGYYFKFNRRALLAVLLESQANFFRTMRDIGAMNNDEVRGLLELNRIPDGTGQNFAQPFNGSGGTAPSKSAAATQPQPATA